MSNSFWRNEIVSSFYFEVELPNMAVLSVFYLKLNILLGNMFPTLSSGNVVIFQIGSSDKLHGYKVIYQYATATEL